MIILIVVSIEILINGILKNCINFNGINQVLLCIINFLILYYIIFKNNIISKRQKRILSIALLCRIVCLFIDEFCFRIPLNNDDATNFDEIAKTISKNMNILLENNIYGGMYSKFLGVIYYCFGNARLFSESINVIFSFETMYLIYTVINKRIFKNDKVKLLLELFVSFFPLTIIFSVCLMREAVTIFLITLSLKYCIDYLEKNKFYQIFISFCSIMIATMLHSGNIFIIIGYVLVFSFYNFKEKKVKLKIKSFVIFIITIGIIVSIIFLFPNIFFTKFAIEMRSNEKKQENEIHLSENIEQENIEYTGFKKNLKNNPVTRAIEKEGRGNSVYIGKRTVNNIGDFILYSCEKVIYFMFAPMPWNWRGIFDFIVFFSDSCIYLICIISILYKIPKLGKNKCILVLFLLIGIILTIALYSIGTSNAGTALRHRHKFLYYLIIMSVLCNTEKVRNLNA